MANLGGFGQLLAQFRASSAWATVGLSAVPFATALADLSPPWPPGIVALTAVVQLLLLALAYIACRGWTRRATLPVMCAGILVAAVAAGAYLHQLSAHTYQVPTTGERFVMGTVCTEDARAVFRDRCPALGLDELRSAEYEAGRLWTRDSIDAMRLRLVALWSLAFAALAWTLGVFFTWQMQAGGQWVRGGSGEAVGTEALPDDPGARAFDTPQPAPASQPRAQPQPQPQPQAQPQVQPQPQAQSRSQSQSQSQWQSAMPPEEEPQAAAGAAPFEPPMVRAGSPQARETPSHRRLLGDDLPMSAGAEAPAPVDAPPAPTVERWFNANIEDHAAGVALQVARTYTLALAVEAQADSNLGAGGSARSELPTATAEYLVKVQLDSPDFRIDDPVRSLRIGTDGLSAGKARFDIVPLHEGIGTITATIVKDGNFVQQMVLAVPVGEGTGALVEVVQRRGRRLASLASLRPRDLSLTIEPGLKGGFDCWATKSGAGRFHMAVEAVLLDSAVERVRAALMRVVDRREANGTYPFQDGLDIPAGAGDEALRVMAEAGYALFQLLFRHDAADRQCMAVGDWLVRHATDPGALVKLQVVSIGFPVPWALLYLADRWDDDALDWERFLGMRHVLEQLPLQNDMPWIDDWIDEAGDGLSVSLNLNLDIDRQMNLDVVGRQERYWQRIVGARPGVRVTRRVSGAELLGALRDPSTDDEILYLYCHATTLGLDEAGGPDGSSLRLDATSPLTLHSLKLRADTRDKLRGQPLVFINACESAELTPLFYSGFVPYFMSKGARGVIGTECRMPALFAAHWADAFFDALLAGKPLGQLVLELRRWFLSEHGNPLGLLYALHCDADAKLASNSTALTPLEE